MRHEEGMLNKLSSCQAKGKLEAGERKPRANYNTGELRCLSKEGKVKDPEPGNHTLACPHGLAV